MIGLTVLAGHAVRLYQQKDPLAGAGRIAPVLTAGYDQVRIWQVTKGTVALYQRKPAAGS